MKRFFLLLCLLSAADAVRAQVPADTALLDKPVFVRLREGTVVRGTLRSVQSGQVRLQTEDLGELVLDNDRIVEINEARGFIRNGQYWFANPFYTNYFFSPTALTLRKGEGNFQNSYLFLNGVNFGVTNALTLGVGALLLPGFNSQTLFLTPKLGLVRQGPVKVGVGTLVIASWVPVRDFSSTGTYREYRRWEFGGIAYGSLTLGDEERNFSFSAGWAYGENTTVARTPVLGLAFQSRVGRKLALVTDNFLVPSGAGDFAGALLTGGVRLFGERIGGDLGLLIPVGTDTRFFALPYASLRLKLGRKSGAD
jgi:hypothetical protein